MVCIDSRKYDLVVDLLRELDALGDPEKALQEVRCLKAASGWRDIATAPKDDRTIMRPHVIWGPMTLQRSRFKQKEFPWMNPGMTAVWPEDAFLPFWMPVEVPPCPGCGSACDGKCRCGKAPALPTMDELPEPPKEGGANG